MTQKKKRRRAVRQPPMPMHQESRRKQLVDRLNWLLDFLNQNIPSLPTGLFLKLMHECLEFLYQDQAQVEIKDICTDTELNRKASEGVQALMKWNLDIILERSRWSIKEKEPYFCDTVEARYDAVVEGNRLSFKPQKKLMPYELAVELTFQYRERNLNVEVTADEEYIKNAFRNMDTEKYAFFSKCYDPDVYSTILLTLVPLLERFPLDCIMICPDCGKYYKSTRKKQSPLCSPCLKKVNTYKWRERKENRPAWNEYMRNLRKGVRDETPSEIRARRAEGKKQRSRE